MKNKNTLIINKKKLLHYVQRFNFWLLKLVVGKFCTELRLIIISVQFLSVAGRPNQFYPNKT